MIKHSELTNQQTFSMIRSGRIAVAAHGKLKIYGRLDCWSGRSKMHTKNRVFFGSENEAIDSGFRPCGCCMKKEYQEWKKSQNEK